MKLKTLLMFTLLGLIGVSTSMNATAQDNRLPRKVLVGTCVFPHYGEFPGIEVRLKEIEKLFDAMGEQREEAYSGKSLDLMLLPEHAVTGGRRSGAKGLAEAKAMPWDGLIATFFAEQARKHGSYIAVPMHEAREGKFYNSVILVDREGKRVGTYDKCFLAVDNSWDRLEGGITAGSEVPVFDCDFGRIGFQICYDISISETWKQLADAKVELVGWCTASPQTILPQMKAVEHGYWVVSSTMRDNATVFQPGTGFVHAQIVEENSVLVSEIDLSYLQFEWLSGLNNGDGFRERFGDRVGFLYKEREDGGLFWSNDPNMSIDQMAEALGLLEHADRRKRSRDLNPHW